MQIPSTLKYDKKGIGYLDEKDIEKRQLILEKRSFYRVLRNSFYSIEGDTSDYIIKKLCEHSLFQGLKIKKMLEGFLKIQNHLSNIDLPVGYYLENEEIWGTIVPYYMNSISIRELLRFPVHDIMDYYYHDENNLRNLLSLYLDILLLLEEMYANNVSYLDIHQGNFVFYENQVKLIDFEPQFIRFKTNSYYYRIILDGYLQLINGISLSLNKINLLIYSGSSFSEVTGKIKTLSKKISEFICLKEKYC